MEGAQEQEFSNAGIDPGSASATPSFVKYQPTLACALPERVHPANVVESSSLAAIKLPQLTYRVTPSVLYCNALSSLQVEAIALSGHTHSTFNGDRRNAMLIGDGAGIGKGRIISGVIKDNFEKGRRKSLWFSKTYSLFDDACRDFRSIGHKASYLKRMDHVFIDGAIAAANECCIFTTYAAFQRKGDAKVAALLSWLGKGFNGVIALDECHEVKNEKCRSSNIIHQLDTCVPKARILYSSATIAETLEGLCYLHRLNLWGENTLYPGGFSQMEQELRKIGMLGLELIAMELKSRGAYVARRLDFSDASFSLVKIKLTEDQRAKYNACVSIWNDIYDHLLRLQQKSVKRYFWAQHQQFFRLLCLSFKIPEVIKNIKRHLKEGKAVIVGLQSTGGFLSAKRQRRELKLLSSLESKLLSVVRQTFEPGVPRYEMKMRVVDLKLPASPLDALVNRLGPRKVSELTGRSVRLEKVGTKFKWRTIRGEKNDRLTHFMNGKTHVAIISAACSTGISLHADHQAKNQKQRVHMTIELPWSAEQVIQQCGRTLRSGQSSVPKYELVVVDVGGENRFGFGVSARMSALGAITQGDRTFSINSIEEFDLNTFYAGDAVTYTLKTISTEIPPLIRYPGTNMITFFSEAFKVLSPVGLVAMGKLSPYMTKTIYVNKFLNRLLGVPLPQQNTIFNYYLDIYNHTIQQHKQAGCYEGGVVDFGKPKDYKITSVALEDRSTIEIFAVIIDCGITFDRAFDIYRTERNCQFYAGKIGKNLCVYLAIPIPDTHKFSLLFPFGLLPTKYDDPHFSKSFTARSWDQARDLWNTNYAYKSCCHAYSSLPCPNSANGSFCGAGNRYKLRIIVTGVLWSNVQLIDKLFRSCYIKSLQLVRCHLNLGPTRPNVVVGVEVPTKNMSTLERKLGKKFYHCN